MNYGELNLPTIEPSAPVPLVERVRPAWLCITAPEHSQRGVSEKDTPDLTPEQIEEAEAEAKTEAPTSTGGAGEAGMWALEQTVRRRFGAQFAAEPQAAERRLAGFLARRGYDWDTIGRLARTLRDEAGDEDAAEGWSGPKSPRIP